MVVTRLIVLISQLLLFAFCLWPEGTNTQGQTSAPEKRRAALDAWLSRLPNLPKTKEEGRLTIFVGNEAVLRVFPDDQFYGVYFYVDYPRPQALPKELRTHNLFCVHSGGSVERIGDVEALKALFKQKLAHVSDEAKARDAAAACGRIAEEFYQDGLYTFFEPEVHVSRHGNDLISRAEIKVKARGRKDGKISVQLTFKPAGEPGDIEIQSSVRPDIRRR
jgi:hypothetical protein